MQAFTTHEGIVAPLDRANVDTDAIIPKQYLKSIRRTGFGPFLFDEWRYLDKGGLDIDVATRRKNPDFVLNDARYRDASILLVRDNFGCGSSREHAVWALLDFGIHCVIAPSFADIFYNNCFKNGVLPIALDASTVDALFACAEGEQVLRMHVDLDAQRIEPADAQPISFDIEHHRKHNLLQGLDDIGLTLEHTAAIRAYEQQRREQKPWLFKEL